MNFKFVSRKEEVAGGVRATAAQPPRTPTALARRIAPPDVSRPSSSTVTLDNSGALLEGLRGSSSFRPLPARKFPQKKSLELQVG